MLAGRHVPPISRAVFLIQAFLRRFKAISDGGTYFVGALKRIPIPFNRSGIEFIMQDPGDCPTFKRCPALAGPSPLIAFSGDSGHVQTADVCLKNIFHDRILLFIDHKGLSVTYSFVTERRNHLVSVPERLFGHTAEHLSGKIVRIIFVKPLNDGFDQPAEHPISNRL